MGLPGLAHRLAWTIQNGDIPEGKQVLHECDNPRCVNPKHLHLGDHVRNMEQMVKNGRDCHHRGSQNGNSKLTEEKVREIKAALALGGKRKELAEMFGVAVITIDRIKYGTQWSHV